MGEYKKILSISLFSIIGIIAVLGFIFGSRREDKKA